VTDRDELCGLIKELAVVHGKVVLSSGREADWYIDLRRITLHRQAAPLVGRVMLEVLGGWSYDAVGGLTLGADPVATAILQASGGAV
jgi:orotate phosphoribosyltransferase